MSFPPYAYVPGGPWPHPVADPDGHSHGLTHPPTAPIDPDRWQSSQPFREAIALFNAGYYWEAHEVWERLWHAHERKGEIAELLKALIKLAAAGVKVREARPAGVRTHAERAHRAFQHLRERNPTHLLGLDLDQLARAARSIADNPPRDPQPHSPVSIVFPFRIDAIGMPDDR